MPIYRVKNKIDYSALGIESRSGKNNANLTAMDVAGGLGLAKLTTRQTRLLEPVYCDNQQAALSLLKELTWEIEIYLILNSQRIAPKVHVKGCALAVLWQFVWLKPCKQCDATGKINEQICTSCNGKGSGKYTKNRQAAIADIPKTTWRRHWLKVFEYFSQLLAEDLAEAETGLIKALK